MRSNHAIASPGTGNNPEILNVSKLTRPGSVLTSVEDASEYFTASTWPTSGDVSSRVVQIHTVDLDSVSQFRAHTERLFLHLRRSAPSPIFGGFEYAARQQLWERPFELPRYDPAHRRNCSQTTSLTCDKYQGADHCGHKGMLWEITSSPLCKPSVWDVRWSVLHGSLVFRPCKRACISNAGNPGQNFAETASLTVRTKGTPMTSFGL